MQEIVLAEWSLFAPWLWDKRSVSIRESVDRAWAVLVPRQGRMHFVP